MTIDRKDNRASLHASVVIELLAISHALQLYADTGRKINRAYTPENMMAAATEITGLKFSPRDYEGAARALDAYLRFT